MTLTHELLLELRQRRRSNKVTRRQRRGRGGARNGGEKVVDNKENSDGHPILGAGGEKFTLKSLMKKDPILLKNFVFLT